MIDIVLVDALIYDGSGDHEPYTASVRITPPRINSIFDFSRLSDHEKSTLEKKSVVIQCNGQLAVCPGFIDMHAHSDLSVIHTPSHLAKITQGVTTEVLGQDGIGYAPVNDECLALIRQQIAGWNGNPNNPEFWSWRSMKEYLSTLGTKKTATNVAVLVPQGNLRMLVLGYDPREATLDEINEMKLILRQSMNEGAIGMSSGLTYVPGMYAPNSELAQLLTVVKEFDGYYCPHHRSYGKGALAAYSEMIDLAKETGVRLHLTHAILNFDENKDRAPELLGLLASARSQGVQISLDTYPYLPGSTTLAAQLPSWAAAGGPQQSLERLQDPDTLKKIRYDVEVVGTDGCHGCTVDWSTIEISGVSNDELRPIVGHTVADITSKKLLGLKDNFEVMVEILIKDKLSTTILQHVGHESNVRAIMQDPFHCGGSDGILTSVKPHPRGHGCFTRYLGHYARELPLGQERDIYANGENIEVYKEVEPYMVFSGGLNEAIAHLTSRPAQVLRLKNRGLVSPGYFADLVVFDPATVRDCATFAHPTVPSKGIEFVFVNGEMAIENGKPTHLRNGRVILNDNIRP